MPQVATNPGSEIRRLRRRRQMSQEQLAASTGLSARTISNLERGVITTPRVSTLNLIADALGVEAGPRGELSQLWASAENPSLTDSDIARSALNFEHLLSEEARRARSSVELILWWTHARVDDALRVDRIQTRRGLLSENRTVDRVVYVYQHDSGDLNWDHVRLMDLGNCRELRRHVVAEHDAVVFELGLDTPLHAGETCMVEHTIDLSAALPTATLPERQLRFGVGIRRSGVAVALRVTCSPGARPLTTTYVWSDRAAGEPALVRDLLLSDAGVASVVLDQAGAGMHQIHVQRAV